MVLMGSNGRREGLEQLGEVGKKLGVGLRGRGSYEDGVTDSRRDVVGQE